jgi:hypothetical protein
MLKLLFSCLFILSISTTAQETHWTFPGTTKPFGYWEASLGLHGWADHLVARNLQLRHTAYLYPGLRVFSILRGNGTFDTITPISPQFDELFIEHLARISLSKHQFDYSIKAGKSRYLRFPEPDRISMFDQVPGTEDLRNQHQTGYAGILGVAEYAYSSYKSDVFNIPLSIESGVHLACMQWVGNTRTDFAAIESYAFLRGGYGILFSELRVGQLAIRPEPLGLGGKGISSYIGINAWNYEVGIMIESIETEPLRTGLMVQFARSPVTEALGKIHFDYTRSPEGFVVQIPLNTGYWGTTRVVPKNAILVEEITTHRVMTYWQNGQGRNFYEHILTTNKKEVLGNSNKKTYIVPVEKPWVLELESLVSPHSTFKEWNDFLEWERKRQGPAQLSQEVIYQIYEAPNETSSHNKNDS